MSKSVNVSRIVLLVVLLMAAIVVLSGPVAGVLDLPEPTAQAKKKKNRPKPPAFNVIQCPTEVNEELGDLCIGTSANDLLVGGPEANTDLIDGEEGNDFYNGGTGGDTLVDSSATSSDNYLFPATGFGRVSMLDRAGNGDVISLQNYSIDDFKVSKNGNSDDRLLLEGSSGRSIEIFSFFDEGEIQGKIETFLFREGSFTGDQVATRATAATAEQKSTLKERLPQEVPSSENATQEDKQESSSPSGDAAQQQEETVTSS